MESIINKDDALIKEYLEVKRKIVDRVNNDSSVDDYYRRKMEYILTEGNIEWFIDAIDEAISISKLSKNAQDLVCGDSVMTLIDHEYILGSGDETDKDYSFKTKEECYTQCDKIKENSYTGDYEPLEKDYKILKVEKREGTLDDNYDWIIDKYENGCHFYIKTDSIYSDNIEIAYIQY